MSLAHQIPAILFSFSRTVHPILTPHEEPFLSSPCPTSKYVEKYGGRRGGSGMLRDWEMASARQPGTP
ncbi:hypothetical protein JCM3263A_01800 [Thermobifida fusca]|jgi:hypothetical protein